MKNRKHKEKNSTPDCRKQSRAEQKNIFPGLSFKGTPVSKKEYIDAYPEYVKRCSGI